METIGAIVELDISEIPEYYTGPATFYNKNADLVIKKISEILKTIENNSFVVNEYSESVDIHYGKDSIYGSDEKHIELSLKVSNIINEKLKQNFSVSNNNDYTETSKLIIDRIKYILSDIYSSNNTSNTNVYKFHTKFYVYRYD